jgi:Mn2+/Fe2+ NRAMP family transporter
MTTLIIGIILFLISAFFYFFVLLSEKDGMKIIKIMLMYFCGIMGVILIVEFSYKSPKHSKEYSLKTEIKQEFINGNLISTDTIYYFTPKKK